MTQRAGPLSGIRILDGASLLAGPTAATLLSEYGADVIKIEQPQGGDTMRRYPPFVDDISMLWKVVGKNRRSVTLDLRDERGRELFRGLVASSDIVTLNNRPATLARWGIDFDDLVKIKTDIVVFHLSAYGRTGPYAERAGFARVAEAFAGLTHRTGFPDQQPSQSGYPMLGDGVAGLYGAFALMLALRQRDLTGEAQLVDLGLYEPLLRLIEDQIVAFDTTGEAMGAVGNSNPLICPNNLFPTKDGRWVSLPASTEPLWRRLIAAMGAQDLAKYDSNRIRIEHREEIESRVRTWTSSYDMLDLVDVCDAAGLAVGPVYSAAEIASDPHIQARGSIIAVEDPDLGRPVRIASSAGRFSGFEAQVSRLGPALGEHTDEVLAEELGLDATHLADLRRDGVI